MSDKYDIEHDKFCYPGTNVLKNNYGIKEQEHLDIVESGLVKEAIDKLEFKFKLGFLMEDHLYLHRQLFKDIYSWAGTVRTCDISKGRTRFCTHSFIDSSARDIEVKYNKLLLVPDESVVPNIVELFADMNVLHPFRDGNGRTLRLHIELLLAARGYSINWDKIERLEWIRACIDSHMGEDKKLTHIFKTIISLDENGNK